MRLLWASLLGALLVIRVVPIGPPPEGEALVTLLNSMRACNRGEPGISAEVSGRFVLIKLHTRLSELEMFACYRHELANYSVSGNVVEIDLALESIELDDLGYGPPGPDIYCIPCEGILETILLVGPLEPGEWVISIDGLSVTVEVPG